MRTKTLSSLLVLLMLTACSKDILPFSSGALQGTEAEIPANWMAVAEAEVIQLETNPAEPYSINLWVIGMDDYLYVHAGANRATWVEHMETDPNVRLGYDGSIYALTSERVTNQEEFDRLSEIYKEKYGNYPRNLNLEEVYLYRLLPRNDG